MILFKIGFHTEEYIYILQNTPDSILKTYVMNDEKTMSKTSNFSILIVSLFYQGFSNTKNTLKNWREKAREYLLPYIFLLNIHIHLALTETSILLYIYIFTLLYIYKHVHPPTHFYLHSTFTCILFSLLNTHSIS